MLLPLLNGLHSDAPRLPRLRANRRPTVGRRIDDPPGGGTNGGLDANVIGAGPGGISATLHNDSVIIHFGGTSPGRSLKSLGIEIVAKYGEAWRCAFRLLLHRSCVFSACRLNRRAYLDRRCCLSTDFAGC